MNVERAIHNVMHVSNVLCNDIIFATRSNGKQAAPNAPQAHAIRSLRWNACFGNRAFSSFQSVHCELSPTIFMQDLYITNINEKY